MPEGIHPDAAGRRDLWWDVPEDRDLGHEPEPDTPLTVAEADEILARWRLEMRRARYNAPPVAAPGRLYRRKRRRKRQAP